MWQRHTPFQHWILQFINEAKQGKYDPDILVSHIIGRLTGGALDLITCQECEAEFVIITSGKKIASPAIIMPPRRCPKCGGLHTIVKETLLAPTLKKIIVEGKPIVMKKQGGDIK